MDGRHGYLTPILHNGSTQAAGQGIHKPFQWEATNATARGALTGMVADDIGKFLLQTDDWSVWILSSISPVTWLQIGNFTADDYYSRTQMQTSGQAQLHWANLTNIGSINSFNDVDTVTTPPDTDDVLTWDGTNWIPGAGGSGGDPGAIIDRILTDGTNVLLDEDGSVLWI